MAFSQAPQQSDLIIKLTGGTKRVIALPDFRAAGAAAPFADVFNKTVYDDIERSGLLAMAPKSFYPLSPPQQEADLRAGATNCGGRCLSDWAAAPVSANYLGFGYAADQGGQFVAFGHLFNTAVADLAGAKLIRKLYNAPLNEDGARKAAHEYAADILAQFGVPSLAGTKIYFISDRSGNKEVWSMEFDGSNQRRVTSFNSITTTPAISPDGLRLAFTTYAKGQPQIMLWSTETNRMIPFLNPRASLNATPNFAPDGSSLFFASSLNSDTQIYVSDVSGANLKRVSTSRAIEIEPKVNPKTGNDLVFVSGRSGPQQIYRMNMDGAGVERLTTGEGEAANPAWHPDGLHIAFKWTRGFAPGNWNIFVMDVASRETVQLTFGAGRNENPVWGPDGRHLAFSSNRGGRFQIYTMLADGSGLKQLTTQGNNTMPVWSK
jgi:TolB protein